ncbi:hypothetical protein BaRGS_00012410, partial [Batillaria attramentaria]
SENREKKKRRRWKKRAPYLQAVRPRREIMPDTAASVRLSPSRHLPDGDVADLGESSSFKQGAQEGQAILKRRGAQSLMTPAALCDDKPELLWPLNHVFALKAES